jgi:hypothetical protein
MVKEYKIKEVEKEETTPVEALVEEPAEASSQPAPTVKKGFSAPSIPTDKIFKVVTDRQMMEQLWRDETMEPHVHMIKLLLMVAVLAFIITLLGL